jgi:hypothetical protein
MDQRSKWKTKTEALEENMNEFVYKLDMGKLL